MTRARFERATPSFGGRILPERHEYVESENER